jgi:hypothetical protein
MVLDLEQRYPYLLGKKLNWKLKPAAIAGSCNKRIIRATYRDCLNLQKEDDIFVLLQLTHLHRTEYAGTRTKDNQWKYSFKEELFEYDKFESVKPNAIDIPPTVRKWADIGFTLHDELAEFNRICSELIGLTSFFKQHNINYLIYTGPKIELSSNILKNDTLYQYLKNDMRILDLLEFNMLELTGKQAHPNKDGMILIADYFYSLLS